MDFMELCKTRRSVRRFQDRPIEQEKLDLILEAGRLAPTAANLQPQRIYVLTSPEAMAKAAEAAAHMVHDAPAALLVCYDSDTSWKADRFGEEYDGGEVDAAIVATHMMMEATELGLGSLWVRGFNSVKAHEVFELPENIHVICFLVLGYADEAYLAKPRTGRKELVETTTIL